MSDENENFDLPEDFKIPDHIPDFITEFEDFRDKAGLNMPDAEYYKTIMENAPAEFDGKVVLPKVLVDGLNDGNMHLIELATWLMKNPFINLMLDPKIVAQINENLDIMYMSHMVTEKLVKGAPDA